MTGEGIDIRNQLHFTCPRCGPANALVERDDQAPVSALIGPDLQQVGLNDAVETCPVEPVVGVVHLAGNRRHQSDLIGLARRQGLDALRKFRIGDVH